MCMIFVCVILQLDKPPADVMIIIMIDELAKKLSNLEHRTVKKFALDIDNY